MHNKKWNLALAFCLLFSQTTLVLADIPKPDGDLPEIDPIEQPHNPTKSIGDASQEKNEDSQADLVTMTREEFEDLVKLIMFLKENQSPAQPQAQPTANQQKPEEAKALFGSASPASIDQALAQEVLLQAPEEIKQIIMALQNPFLLGKDTPKQLLLVGPPGTGKSTLALAMAWATNRSFTFIHAPSLVNEYVHSGASNLKRLFEPLLKSTEPHIVVIDEMTCLTDQHKNERGDSMENATALWLLLDECRQKDNIFFIGITNDAKKMPAQLKSRFLGNVVEIPLPTLESKKEIFNFLLSRNNSSFDINKHQGFLTRFIKKTADYSIREIEALISLAKRFSIGTALENNGIITLEPKVLERARALIEQQKTKILDFGAEQDTLQEKLHKESMEMNKGQHKIGLFFQIFGVASSIASFGFGIYQYLHPREKKKSVDTILNNLAMPLTAPLSNNSSVNG